MKKVLGIITALTLVLSLAPAVSASDLQTTSGTMQLGGNLTFDIDMYMPESGDSTTGMKLAVEPMFGYFVIDNLELLIDVKVDLRFGDLYEGSETVFGFDVGARYLLDLGGMNLGLGVLLGMAIVSPDEGDSLKSLVIAAPIGLIIPLNPHVGLELGLRFQYVMGLDDQGSFLMLPIGYLGVAAFF